MSVDALASEAGRARAAVAYAGFGGEVGAQALVDVLFGDAPASGRLPWTVPPQSWGEARLVLYGAHCQLNGDSRGMVSLR